VDITLQVFLSWHWIEMSDQLHSPAALPPVSTGQQAMRRGEMPMLQPGIESWSTCL